MALGSGAGRLDVGSSRVSASAPAPAAMAQFIHLGLDMGNITSSCILDSSHEFPVFIVVLGIVLSLGKAVIFMQVKTEQTSVNG
ncbi:hypothetical protein YWY31_25530 [Paenibacillus illinoisensis]